MNNIYKTYTGQYIQDNICRRTYRTTHAGQHIQDSLFRTIYGTTLMQNNTYITQYTE